MHTLYRSSRGCWTCRIRKKKCDESHPRCKICAALRITCHFTDDKPSWMDNGSRQSQMLMQIKREVRENAHRRPRGQNALIRDTDLAVEDDDAGNSSASQPSNDDNTAINRSEPSSLGDANGLLARELGREDEVSAGTGDILPMSHAEKIMVANFSEFVFPRVFAAYNSCIHGGGRTWLTEFANDSSAIRRILCHHSILHFAALQGCPELDILKVEAYQMSRSIIASAVITTQLLSTKSDQERVTAGVAILISILLVQHLNAAVSIHDPQLNNLKVARKVYEQIFTNHSTVSPVLDKYVFPEFVRLLEQPKLLISKYNVFVPSFECAALTFAIGQLVFDDIIASTMLGESPYLRPSHSFLLGSGHTRPRLDLETVVRCSNKILLQISKITELTQWKRDSKQFKTFDVVEFAGRVTNIKTPLAEELCTPHAAGETLCCHTSTFERGLVSARKAIWIRATLLYLHIVADGFQSGHVEVQDHIVSILGSLEDYRSHPSFLQAVAWPLCVSGCLAENMHQDRFVELLNGLNDAVASGKFRAAFNTMKLVWSKGAADAGGLEEFADIFKDQQNSSIVL